MSSLAIRPPSPTGGVSSKAFIQSESTSSQSFTAVPPLGAVSFVVPAADGSSASVPPTEASSTQAPSFGDRIISLHNGAISKIATFIHSPTLRNLEVKNGDPFFATLVKVASCVLTLYIGVSLVCGAYDGLKYLWNTFSEPQMPPSAPASTPIGEQEIAQSGPAQAAFRRLEPLSPRLLRRVDSASTVEEQTQFADADDEKTTFSEATSVFVKRDDDTSKAVMQKTTEVISQS